MKFETVKLLTVLSRPTDQLHCGSANKNEKMITAATKKTTTKLASPISAATFPNFQIIFLFVAKIIGSKLKHLLIVGKIDNYPNFIVRFLIMFLI